MTLPEFFQVASRILTIQPSYPFETREALIYYLYAKWGKYSCRPSKTHAIESDVRILIEISRNYPKLAKGLTPEWGRRKLIS